ncbi:hypothetical protein FA10DRAFT_200822 [Acaromyces ingoldii]|uniref:Uncharacterized protein n=1 Tax=Acaromyces ingoldii TaxID=215250 RepID=A0A316YC38_9BASI|nr:hypothetical protein FA10DRAFT_200822 [Acaromyces ingoldii]PWN86842.1 hypothetical protein FA10DRAFT_200822 [Acaromyces ingoldii]
MSLLLAPYNNAMRIGQGFNSFTQQICIDSAVVTSPKRPENFVTNDGVTMRTMALDAGGPSLWTASDEVLVDEARIDEARRVRDQMAQKPSKGTAQRIVDEPGMEHFDPEQRIARQELIRARARRQQSESDDIDTVTAPSPPPYAVHDAVTDRAGEMRRSWQVDHVGGPSQTVTFTSRFVDSLSQVTKDMGISASLSIKAGTVAGSGRGAFIDSDRFADSDLNYFISVKVCNMSINHRDALEFNPLPASARVAEANFAAVYGDCFISGFLEGGEFNALVSMKVLDTARLTDIEAAASVAFSSGMIDVKAEASFEMAKSNLKLNTETAISASWTGGGNIKHPGERWTIESLARAASRFPQNVAQCPQRTHAILTKYDRLRSYMALKPAGLSKLAYENVVLYADELAEAFADYKAMLAKIQQDMRDIQQGAKRFRRRFDPAAAAAAAAAVDAAVDAADAPAFEASIDGLEQACAEIRPQLGAIVDRIDLLAAFPDVLTNPEREDPGEHFMSPVRFWQRLPAVEDPRTGRLSTMPLKGKRIGAGPSEKDAGKDAKPPGAPSSSSSSSSSDVGVLCEEEPSGLALTPAEVDAMTRAIGAGVGSTADDGKAPEVRLSRPAGAKDDGQPFFGLDYAHRHLQITSIEACIARGSLASLSIGYANGMCWHKGLVSRSDRGPTAAGGGGGNTAGNERGAAATEQTAECTRHALDDFGQGETIVAAEIETGQPAARDGERQREPTVTALRLKTSTGRLMEAQARIQTRYGHRARYLDGWLYTSLETHAFPSPLDDGSLVGFYGLARCADEEKKIEVEVEAKGTGPSQPMQEEVVRRIAGIHRLGIVWATQGSSQHAQYGITRTEQLTATSTGRPAALVSPLVEKGLLDTERALLATSKARERYRGISVDQPLLSVQSLLDTPEQCEHFNDCDLADLLRPEARWPTSVSFLFSVPDTDRQGHRRLGAIRTSYGRLQSVHGVSMGTTNENLLQVDLEPGERIVELGVQRPRDGDSPNGLAVVTNRGRTLSLNGDKTANSRDEPLRKAVYLKAPSGKHLKGFFSLEVAGRLARVRPIWA